MMKSEEILHSFLGAIEKKIPENAKLADTLADMLFMEKGAIYRRLRGEVPFTFFEAAQIAEKLNISLNSLIYNDLLNLEHFEMKLIEFTELNDIENQQWDRYIALIDTAKDDPHSELAESSNVLPLSIFAGFDSLPKYFLFKWQYLFSGMNNRITFHDLVVPERLHRIYRSYFEVSRKVAKTIYVWDYLIFQYLVTDIKYFSSINLISDDDVQQIKQDLLALLDYIEEIAINGCFEETGNHVSFYISDINLDADYSYVQINDIRISLVRTFILNSVASTDQLSFEKIKDWIQSLTKSSTLITQSGAVHRADFFEKQRMMISEF
jgi:hypothetical protein